MLATSHREPMHELVISTLQRAFSSAVWLPSLAGRTVIDAMNRFSDPLRSTTQDLADRLPGARLVKAFNTTGFENMSTARERSLPAAMFIAGDDGQAKARVTEILRAFGWREPIDAGPIASSRLLEALAMLWVLYGVRNDHWTHAFSLLGRKS